MEPAGHAAGAQPHWLGHLSVEWNRGRVRVALLPADRVAAPPCPEPPQPRLGVRGGSLREAL